VFAATPLAAPACTRNAARAVADATEPQGNGSSVIRHSAAARPTTNISALVFGRRSSRCAP
jgi:hypothetical protein